MIEIIVVETIKKVTGGDDPDLLILYQILYHPILFSHLNTTTDNIAVAEIVEINSIEADTLKATVCGINKMEAARDISKIWLL